MSKVKKTKEKQKTPEIGQIKKRSITEEMQESYLDYAMSVIVSRALPDVRDGLKPVHRRILYAMHGMGLNSGAKYRKSAAITGECFVKDTLVLTSKGLIPIQEVERGDKVYTQKGSNKVTQIYEMPKKKLLKVTLKNGTSNTVTPSQKFKVIDSKWNFKWKEAKDLTENDFLVARSFYPEIKKTVTLKGVLKNFPLYLDEGLAYFLGLVISDGWIAEDYSKENLPRVGVCSTDIGVIDKICTILEDKFGYNAKVEIKNDKNKGFNQKLYSVRINRKDINDFLVTNFSLKGTKALTKKIPIQIFRSPKNVIFSFISGLIEGDGHISRSRNVIHYGSISERLVDQLMVLLQHQGILSAKLVDESHRCHSRFGHKIIKRHKFYSLEFRGKSAVELARKINLVEEAKNKKCLKLSLDKITRRKAWSSCEVVPYASSLVFSELSSSHLGGGWYQAINGLKFRSGIKHISGCKIRYSKDLREKAISKTQLIDWGIGDKLKKIGSHLFEFIDHFVKDDIYFLKVSSIEEASSEKTYDIQVANEHEFLANGIVSHNCLGKYHPHGDLAVYESLVRMAQDFSLRYPLVDGQGNFGSLDGDSAAAPRYTEARMTKISEEMLADIDKETVDWMDNYDGTRQEPWVLPAKLPQLLVNGVFGIAVGMTTNIPPHNLGEVIDAAVYFIDHPKATVKDLFQFIKGPDFPTGGEVYDKKGMIQSYSTGRGPIVNRAKAEIVEPKAGKYQIIINEMTYGINKANLIAKIADLYKAKKLQGIKDVRDESDKDGVRVVIDLKSEASPQKILNRLYKLTDLQKTFHMNMLALVDKGLQPQILSLVGVLEEYVKHRQDVVTRRTKYLLKQAKERAHILEGLNKALDHIDAVVNTIKKSPTREEAHKNLMKKFKLSDRQAAAILEMRLQTLAGLEQKKIKDELKEKKALIKELEALLKSPRKILTLVKKELKELKEKFADERRTKVYSRPIGQLTDEDLVPKEECVIILTQGGYIKRVNPQAYKAQKRGGKGILGITPREEDAVGWFLSSSTHDNLLFFTDQGRVFQSMAYEIPEASRIARGQAIVNILQLGSKEQITAVLKVTKGQGAKYLVMSTENGIIKRTKTDDFANVRRSGLVAIKLKGDDRLKWAKLTSGDDEIFLVTIQGQSIRFKEKDVRSMSRAAAGVRGINLKGDDKLVRMDVITKKEGEKGQKVLVVTENGFGKRTDLKNYKQQKRGGMGIKTAKLTGKTGNIVASHVIKSEQEDLIAISKKGQVIRTKLKSIATLGRATQGVKVMKMNRGDKVVSIACI